MKFTCNQQILSKALNTVSKAVSTKTTINILRGILIKVTEDGKLILTASDLDLSIEKVLDVTTIEPGSVVVMARLFGDIIRRLPNEELTIEEKEEGSIIIKSSTSEFKIVGLPADEFPMIGEVEESAETVVLNKELMKDMIRKTSFSASIDESKGVIVGVLLEMKEDKLNFVALDGFRMAVCKTELKNSNEKNIIISAKILNDVNKIISDLEDDADVKMILSNKKAILLINQTKVVIRLLEGEFIKYRDIMPKEHKCRIIAERNKLMDSIERASLLAKEGRNNLVIFSIRDGNLTITSKSEEGNVREEIYIEKEGDDLDIGFNSKYILDVLKVIDDEKVILDFNANINPCIVRSIEGDKYEYLILPVRITN